jgi:dTDP-4-amino-4,6-dideoxy-D-galactose acyltransferase
VTATWLRPRGRAVEHAGLSFLRDLRPALAEHVEGALREGLARGDVEAAGSGAVWYWQRLAWDSEHFGLPVIRLVNASWDPGVPDAPKALAEVLVDLRTGWDRDHERYYVFAELPPEDPLPIQALGLAGFRLIETRLTYFLGDARALGWTQRYPVRQATMADVEHLREVAAEARNAFDRYHADPFFGAEVADEYLATYAEASMNGLADLVLVPDPGDDEPPGAFFTGILTRPPECPLGSGHVCTLEIATGRIPLVAVGQARRGWHLRLLAEMTRLLAERGAEVIHMTTQATNRAVIRNCEKVGYRFGRASHVLACVGGGQR